MAISARGGLALVRGLLQLRARSPGPAQSLLPFACSLANSLLLNVGDRAVRDELLRGKLLAPTEQAVDFNSWADNNPTRTWLRKYWLTSTFRGTPRYHVST